MYFNTRKTPSFQGLTAASAASSHAKRQNRGAETSPERILRSHLWKLGLRYRKNVKSIPGKPDIVFAAVRLAVFCDGDFWHGRNWRALSAKLVSGANASYWLKKITTNRERDRRTSRELSSRGWTVLRVWESDIRKSPQAIAHRIEAFIREQREASHAVH